MDRLEKLRNDAYSFEELNTLEKNAKKLNDLETLDLISESRLSKTAKGGQPIEEPHGNANPSSRRARRRKS